MKWVNAMLRVGALVLVVCVAGGCSTLVSGKAQPQRASDSSAPVVPPGALNRLLLSESRIGEIVGDNEHAAGGFIVSQNYAVIEPAHGQSYSDPSCAVSLYNAMYTGYTGGGYTGVAGRELRDPGPHPTKQVDEAVVAFPNADIATRFVIRTVLAWERCADTHLITTWGPPVPDTTLYTLGFPSVTGDVSAVINVLEGGEGAVRAHAITSRANVVIDVNVFGSKLTAAQPVAVVTAIAQNMPHD